VVRLTPLGVPDTERAGDFVRGEQLLRPTAVDGVVVGCAS
jgi:hypothetical protein